MQVVQLDGQSEIFTLCFDNNGELEPVTDFSSHGEAIILKDMINETGFAIKLSDHATTREFSIGRKHGETFKIEDKASDLTEALRKLGIKVTFSVEPPPMQTSFDHFYSF